MPTKIKFVQFLNPVGPLQQAQAFHHSDNERLITLDDGQRFFEIRRKHHSGTWEETIVPMGNVASFVELVEPKPAVKPEEKKK